MTSQNESLPPEEGAGTSTPKVSKSLGRHLRKMEGNLFVMVPKTNSDIQVEPHRTYMDPRGEEYWCIPIENLDLVYYSGLTRYDDDEGEMEPQGGGPPL